MPAQKRLTPEMVGEAPVVLEPLRLRLADLTGRQAYLIEKAIGVPLSRLPERASDVMVAAAIRSAVEGRPIDRYLDGYTAIALIESVDILDDEDDDPGND